MLMNQENVDELRLALKDLEPRHRMNPSHKPSFLDEPKNVSNLKNIHLETNAGILDGVSMGESLGSYGTIKARSIKVNLFNFDCRVLSLDDLIRVKETMRRPKDLIVLEELKALKNHQD